jgi:hypothetical protein
LTASERNLPTLEIRRRKQAIGTALGEGRSQVAAGSVRRPLTNRA